MKSIAPPFSKTGLLIVDVQRRLVDAMPKSVRPFIRKNITNLIELAQDAGGPVVVTEQYPKGLGSTISSVLDYLDEVTPIPKIEFNSMDNPEFLDRGLTKLPKHVIVVGIETHICVLQTAIGLIETGHKIYVPLDCVASRSKQNWRNGLELLRSAGALITNTETLIFQYLRTAGTDQFTKFSELVR